MTPQKPTVVLDFDGVVNSYQSGWTGREDDLPDPPMPGVADFLRQLLARYLVVIVTTRAKKPSGQFAVESWLVKHGLPAVPVTAVKPPAIAYVDDRAVRYRGDWLEVLDGVRELEGAAPSNR